MEPATGKVVYIPSPEDRPGTSSPRGWIGVVLVAAIVMAVILAWQTKPLAPAYQWAAVEGPARPVNLDSLVALHDDFALLSGVTPSGVELAWGEGAGRWAWQALQGSPTQLSAGDDALVAYRARTGAVLTRVGESWSVATEVVFPDEARSRRASGRPGVHLVDGGILEMSLYGDVWWGPDADEFDRVIRDPSWGFGVERPFNSVCAPPSRSSPDVPPSLVTDGGWVSLVSSHPNEPFGIWPVCEPVLWTSDDGRVWSWANTSLTNHGAYVYDLGWRDGVLIAVGGYGIDQPAVWTSTNGIEWLDITPASDESVDLYRVDVGGAGWVILGRATFHSSPVGWTSHDGACWEPLPEQVRGTDAAVSDSAILVVDRTHSSQMWLGSPTGFGGTCR